ncbi:hypothetical protein ZIOFF_026750 [Zingiber officinale]|uniref:CG-1 domain-containing protein n=1 Tax=Zingiber officinale TaxID=94328 RepID=A0A8J5GXW3_ZINOF|nr:hypothetical protein ZIOFF_026750 [Zingiber officinale]
MAGAKRGEVNTSFGDIFNEYADIEQLLVEAQHRWLRPAEICELLQNYKKFRIAPEPPNKPPSMKTILLISNKAERQRTFWRIVRSLHTSGYKKIFITGGSLFLFDRKVSRYFRKDGHNWRKKKDGKTVKEAHERLKVAMIWMYPHTKKLAVLICFIAIMLMAKRMKNFNDAVIGCWKSMDLMHIVLVHYREVKEKPSFSRTTSLSHAREVEEVKQVTQMCKVSIPNSTMSQSQPPSQTMGADSPVSSHTSEYEDAESGYPKQTLMQRIIIKQLPDTTLSLRCGSMMIDK